MDNKEGGSRQKEDSQLKWKKCSLLRKNRKLVELKAASVEGRCTRSGLCILSFLPRLWEAGAIGYTVPVSKAQSECDVVREAVSSEDTQRM